MRGRAAHTRATWVQVRHNGPARSGRHACVTQSHGGQHSVAAAYTRRTCARCVHVGHAEHAHHGVTRVTWNHAGRVGVYVWGREAHACHVRLHVSPVWPTRVSHAPAWRCRWGHACHPPPRQPGTSTGQRATPTRVTPGDTGHSKGSGEATGRAPGGLQGTTRTDTRVRDLPSGSDQRRSHMGPSWGTSCLRSMVRIWSSVWMEGERPPCTQKICGDTRALSVREACTLSP